MDDHAASDWIRASGCDPITLSVILSRLAAITDEMTLTLERSAWTPILSVCRDFSCALFDSDCRQIAMHDAIPVHTNSLSLLMKEIAKAFSGDVHDGDVYMCNDPYRYNTHVGDVVTAAPVFVDGAHLFWSVTKGHQLDIGAFVPSSVTAAAANVWQEGLIIPPLKLCDRGKMRGDVMELYLCNVRYRDLILGDLMAQLGSVEKGRERLIELVREYGAADVVRYKDAMLAYAARRMKEELRRIPEGVYRAEGWIDSDGVDVLDIPIRATITVREGRVNVDYSESGPQARGGVNGSIATSQAAGATPFLYYVDPDIPHNQGAIDQISVTTRPGTICNPHYPASTSCATVVPSNLMSDVVNMAMAGAIPDRVLAGNPRSANTPQFAGEADWTGKPWGVMLFNNRGGMGAASDIDGWPEFGSHASFGGIKAQSVEQLELIYPIEIESMEIEPDSMGLGKHIGGPGIRMSVRPVLAPVECITFGDGYRFPPHGVAGGTPGIGGGHYVESTTGARAFASGAAILRFEPGERYVGVSSGGGGHGDPLQRPVEQIRQDVRDGLVTRATARMLFGVVFDDGFDPQVIEDESEALRRELRKQARPAVEPTSPNSGVWLKQNMRPGDSYLLNPGRSQASGPAGANRMGKSTS